MRFTKLCCTVRTANVPVITTPNLKREEKEGKKKERKRKREKEREESEYSIV